MNAITQVRKFTVKTRVYERPHDYKYYIDYSVQSLIYEFNMELVQCSKKLFLISSKPKMIGVLNPIYFRLLPNGYNYRHATIHSIRRFQLWQYFVG